MNSRLTRMLSLALIGVILFGSLYVISLEHRSLKQTIIQNETNAIKFSILNGRVISMRGDQVTANLWMEMKDCNASNHEIKHYIEWIQQTVKNPETLYP